MHIRPRLACGTAVFALWLGGCSIVTVVEPLRQPISSACIRDNPAVWSKQFQPELQQQFARHGVQTQVFDAERPATCVLVVEYTAEWTWDFAVYLEYADIRIDDVRGAFPKTLGRVTYDAREADLRFDKFGPGSRKLEDLIDRLFASLPANAKTPTTRPIH